MITGHAMHLDEELHQPVLTKGDLHYCAELINTLRHHSGSWETRNVPRAWGPGILSPGKDTNADCLQSQLDRTLPGPLDKSITKFRGVDSWIRFSFNQDPRPCSEMGLPSPSLKQTLTKIQATGWEDNSWSKQLFPRKRTRPASQQFLQRFFT